VIPPQSPAKAAAHSWAIAIGVTGMPIKRRSLLQTKEIAEQSHPKGETCWRLPGSSSF